MPLKNIIMDRLKMMCEPPNQTLFSIGETAKGPVIWDQPWGPPKKMTWEQAEKFLGLNVVPRKPMQRSQTITSISSHKGRRKTG